MTERRKHRRVRGWNDDADHRNAHFAVAPGRLPIDRSEMEDPCFGSVVQDAERGVPLADFECAHGRLPTDRDTTCDCWGPPFPQEALESKVKSAGGGYTSGRTSTRRKS